MLNDGKIVKLTGKKDKALKTSSGQTIAKVAEVTYDVSQNTCNALVTVLMISCRNSKWKALDSLKMESWSTWAAVTMCFKK